jgi:hypothetical protein
MAQYGCGWSGKQYGAGRKKVKAVVLHRSTRRTKTPTFYEPELITKKRKRWCKCLVGVAKKQTKACLRYVAGGRKTKKPKNCVNPYAACAKKAPKPLRERRCANIIKLESLDDEATAAYAALRGQSVNALLTAAAKEIRALKRRR